MAPPSGSSRRRTQVTPVALCSLKALRALAMPPAARTDTEVERIAHMRVTCGNGFERTNEYNARA